MGFGFSYMNALKPRLKDFLTNVYFSLKFIFGLLHNITTLTNMSMKVKKKQIFPWIHREFLDKSHVRKMIIFPQVILKSWFSTRTLMFSFQNFPTPMRGTLCLLMIPHINLYLMIRVMLYFWNYLKVLVVMGTTYFPPFFLTWSRFTCLGLVFTLMWNIIL
jgi:hypothetical protein